MEKSLSKGEVAGIVAAIVFVSALICLAMLFMMVRIWCNWRRVLISSSEGSGAELKRDEMWIHGNEKRRNNGDYWKMNSWLAPSHEKHPSSTCIFQLKMDVESPDRTSL
ncbi:hypothetical protein NL676_003280 [Syzygium grande]|nr:hypothetical protein NL676_003280 [Syzygium grande]